MPKLRLPLNAKAAEAIRNAPRPIDLGTVNNLAGWDADAQFVAARAKLKVVFPTAIHHRFIGEGGVIMHEYSC